MKRILDISGVGRSDRRFRGPIEWAKWWVFRALERLSDLKGSVARPMVDLSGIPSHGEALWLFASTIGELNAIEPLVKRVLETYADLKFVIISDHEHYQAAFRHKYPQAVVVNSKGHSRDAAALARAFTPRLFLVAEIPCAITDAPCRLSYAFLRAARQADARCVIVNGWLYGDEPASRMDALEARLFGSDYIHGFDRICVQTDAVRDTLIARGGRPLPVEVTGNIKFDAVHPEEPWRLEHAKSPALLGGFTTQSGPVIVGGCVTAYPEQEIVLDAFVLLRGRWPDARLTLAPRHAEFQERMEVLRGFLRDRGLSFAFRSEIEDQPLAKGIDCLVLDTVGELVDFYAVASATHVGRNHNILEPLRFGKQATVLPDWDSTFPSFPAYVLARDKELVREAATAEALAEAWEASMDDRGAALALSGALDRLREVQGATERVFRAIRSIS